MYRVNLGLNNDIVRRCWVGANPMNDIYMCIYMLYIYMFIYIIYAHTCTYIHASAAGVPPNTMIS